MSRIAVITSGQPFGGGGHLVIADGLVQALRDAGHQAELVLTPQNRFGRQGAAYLATWLTDVGMAQDGGRIDQVITLRYPAYAVRHDAHVCWLTHRMREYYDLWDRFSRDADADPAGQGGHSAAAHPRGGPPLPDQAGPAAVRHLRDDRAAAPHVGRNPVHRAASAAPAASVPV